MEQFKLSLIISTIIVVVGVVAIAYFGMVRVDQNLRLKAVEMCNNSSRFEETNVDTGTKYSYVVFDAFKGCMKQAGFDTK